jgi:Uri superfamily endonuclease
MLIGLYLLYIQLKKNQIIRIGRLGPLRFYKGFYVYIGSARNGVIPRVSRHLRPEKKLFWHIDYFLNNPHTNIRAIYFIRDCSYTECAISEIFLKNYKKKSTPVIYFGCSDCRCKTHLYYFPRDFKIKDLPVNFELLLLKK